MKLEKKKLQKGKKKIGEASVKGFPSLILYVAPASSWEDDWLQTLNKIILEVKGM